MRVSNEIICIIVLGVLAVASVSLSPLWQGFAIFAGLFYMSASGIFAFRQYKKLQAFKTKLAEDRYTDAYIYADENYADFDPQNYFYSKKEEKKITSELRNRKGMLYVGLVQVFTGAALAVVGIIILIG